MVGKTYGGQDIWWTNHMVGYIWQTRRTQHEVTLKGKIFIYNKKLIINK